MADAEPINNYGTYRRPPTGGKGRRAVPRLAPVSRYDGSREKTWAPPDGLGRMPASANADTVVAAVADPYGDGTERVLVTVNRRVDVLELERSHDRISDAAYQTGRVLQAAFERQGRIGGTNWAGTSRRDPSEVQFEALLRLVCNAREIVALLDLVRGRIGERNLRILRRVLGERMGFAACAALEGKAGPRGQAFISESFRVALEDAVAALQQAVGKARPAPDDAHATAAPGVAGREDASLVAGATLGRVEGEIDALRAAGRARAAEELVPAAAELRRRQAVAFARRTR